MIIAGNSRFHNEEPKGSENGDVFLLGEKNITYVQEKVHEASETTRKLIGDDKMVVVRGGRVCFPYDGLGHGWTLSNPGNNSTRGVEQQYWRRKTYHRENCLCCLAERFRETRLRAKWDGTVVVVVFTSNSITVSLLYPVPPFVLVPPNESKT